MKIRIALAAAIALATVGCGGGKSANEGVSGKVTLNGTPVSGQVVFVSADGKQVPIPISPDGSFTAMGLPQGEVEVLVTAEPKVNAMAPKGVEALPKSESGGATPPEKYTKPGNGLKFTVTGKKQTQNFELTS